jgi:hypothetical protein
MPSNFKLLSNIKNNIKTPNNEINFNKNYLNKKRLLFNNKKISKKLLMFKTANKDNKYNFNNKLSINTSNLFDFRKHAYCNTDILTNNKNQLNKSD